VNHFVWLFGGDGFSLNKDPNRVRLRLSSRLPSIRSLKRCAARVATSWLSIACKAKHCSTMSGAAYRCLQGARWARTDRPLFVGWDVGSRRRTRLGTNGS